MKHQTHHFVPKFLMGLGVVLFLLVAVRYLQVGGRPTDLEVPWQLSFLAVAALLMAASGFVTYYEYHGFGCQDGIVRGSNMARNEIVITFDDGPSSRYTPAILDILKEKGVKAAFFVTGRQVHKYPEIARRIVAEGHDIGNHTYSHRELVPATRRAILRQLRRTDRLIESATGKKTRLFRPPRGIYSNAVRKLLVEEGYQMVLWAASGLDWQGVSARRIVRRVLRYARPGGIILLHDGGALIRKEGASRRSTVEALPLIIDGLVGKGYRIVSLSHLLEEESTGAEKPAEAPLW